MAKLILPRDDLREMIRDRAERGADRFDEVWNGVYVMARPADNEHQELLGGILAVTYIAVEFAGIGWARLCMNVSDHATNWKKNYRVPDIAVFLEGTAAQNKGSHWYGGPDFAIEITSRGDRTHKKLPFYARVGTRELLIVDRQDWVLELYRLENDRLTLVGTARPGDGTWLSSVVVPLSFALEPGTARPAVEVSHADGVPHWTV